jgi:hypothetical protein
VAVANIEAVLITSLRQTLIDAAILRAYSNSLPRSLWRTTIRTAYLHVLSVFAAPTAFSIGICMLMSVAYNAAINESIERSDRSDIDEQMQIELTEF